MIPCPACEQEHVFPNRPPLESLNGPDGELFIWHFECRSGHRFHAACAKDTMTSPPGYSPMICNCPD
jgi:hypothetical protein